MWLLTQEEIATFPKTTQKMIGQYLAHIQKTGLLAQLIANGEHVLYETVSDPVLGWKLAPLGTPKMLNAIRAFLKAQDECRNPESKEDYSEAIDAAERLCREAIHHVNEVTHPPRRDAVGRT